jgi:hypothetical protein
VLQAAEWKRAEKLVKGLKVSGRVWDRGFGFFRSEPVSTFL